MEAYLNSLTITSGLGFEFTPSLANLFLMFIFVVCTLLMTFLGVALGRANPCMFFGVFCAFLSNRELIPIFSAEAMWIPLTIFPAAFSGLGLYALISGIMWLVDSDGVKIGDNVKQVLAVIYAVLGAALMAVFLYIFVTQSFLIVILVAAALCVLGIFNQRRVIADSHRFHTYEDLFNLQVDGYTMKLQEHDVDLDAYRLEQAKLGNYINVSIMDEPLDIGPVEQKPAPGTAAADSSAAAPKPRRYMYRQNGAKDEEGEHAGH